ncbi:MAG: NUDIX domain-containing protein [Myxococcota bacterium]|jgi:predicted NUDIX family NTP pyrophosphohydrolase
MGTELHSAALALVRGEGESRQVLIVHPGGPFWARRDAGAWSLPKGLVEEGEDLLEAALREFTEETGAPRPAGPYEAIGEVTLKSGKRVTGFAARGDFDVTSLTSHGVDVEYPPGSGRTLRFEEVDQAKWVTLEEARVLLNPAQVPLAERALAATFLG